MAHVNENRLRELYAKHQQRDFGGFLAGCTDDVLFAVPGYASVSGTYSRAEASGWLSKAFELTGGTLEADIIEVVTNDEHGVVLVVHHFDRDGEHYEYQTAHLVEFRDGKVSRWTEHPGSMSEFEAAWGRH